MVDMINVPDKVTRAKRAEELGASYVCLHVGIDEQMKGEGSPLEIVSKVSKAINIPLAVAGGITSETAPRMIEQGASIIIVGGGIIKTGDVRSAARAVKEGMRTGKGLPNALSKKYGQEDLFEAFAKVSTCNIADAAHKRGVMDNGIVLRNGHGVKTVGRALTVQTAKGDWAKPVEAIDRARKGDIVVIDAGGSEIAVWGELAANSALVKGVAGVIIDGAARDIDGIIDLGFPCFSRHVSPHAGEPKGFGGIGLEIVCGGQMVRTGDWIVGDESGVVVVPQEHAVELANRSVDVWEREERIREEIKRGGTLSKVQELEKWEQVK
jgi:3-hexulose-6-phosphate synthase/6-phospho-3-hexuloisomerase